MSRVLFIILLFTILYSCNEPNKSPDSYVTITGNITKSYNDTIVLKEVRPNEILPIDSIATDRKGDFSFHFECKEPSFYLLYSKSNKQSVTLVCEAKEEIVINSQNINSFNSNYNIKGSPQSILLKQIEDNANKNMLLLDSMKAVYQLYLDSANIKEIKHNIDSTVIVIAESNKKFLKTFIKKYPNSFTSIIALYKTFLNKQVFNHIENFEYYLMIDSALTAKYPTCRHTIAFNKRVKDIQSQKARQQMMSKQIVSGEKINDIVLHNIYGQPVTLSSLKGKYVLINFWASWSEPSVKEIPRIKKLYNKYKNNKFEIFAVSLDEHRREWEYFVKKEDLKWINVSDLTHWRSPIVKQFNIEYLPYKILIDSSQTIIEKNISLSLLENKLDSVFKKSDK